ncbi:stromal membrane-associated protein [Talaromyces pinophilus]|uniref:Stromal membrane-associated protein n=1 Tax=Talaromyces pinophilus TaxID=128442 RepID=A0A6V8H4Z9_TALPI|nr:stromal membrane-associated protein [Talaromyces pinophilus]
MSRRPDPARAAQNQQTIKNLLKLESNKTCADCKRNKPPRVSSPASIGGAGLFDSIASNTQASKPATTRNTSISSNGLDFGFAQNFTSPVSQPAKPAPPAPSVSNDLFDLAAPSQPVSPPAYSQPTSSVFNLSSTTATQPAQKAAPTTSTSNVTSMFSSSSIDPWGGNAWSTPDPVSAPAPPAAKPTTSARSSITDSMRMPDTLTGRDIGAGWGAPPASTTTTTTTSAATVAPEDDFGGWTSAAPVSNTTTSTSGNKPAAGGFAANDDLFSNVWE